MEEKNLMRLLNNLNFCIYHNCAMCSRWNNHLDEDDCREELFNSVVGFIHSLQSDNAKQKAEIERLTERLDYFQKSSDYHEGNQKELEAKNAELQKQVYDWVRVHDEQLHCMQVLTIKNNNLQKQVDELEQELEKAYEIERANIQAEIAEAGASCHWCKSVTVKNTAKKIYQEIDKSDILVVETQEYGEIEVVPIERLKEIIKSKGVEVE